MRIGIDLGTTNTLAAYIDEAGNIQRIQFRNGRTDNKYLLPSCVAYDGTKLAAGQPALDISAQQSNRAVSNIKYHMGTDKTWMLGRIKTDPTNAAAVILSEVHDELKRQFPQESTFHAFVTVPARFDTQAPRQATKEALKAAGFEYDEGNALTDEPVAAAVAYSRALDGTKNVLVVDMGGGTFDLSLIKSSVVGFAAGAERIEPVAWGGDKALGGNDFDEALLRLISEKVYTDTGTELKSMDPRSLDYTPEQSAAVCAISGCTAEIKNRLYAPGSEGADIYIPELLPDYDLEMTISREDYERETEELSARMKLCLDGLFDSAGLMPAAADKVLVVGGMARECRLIQILTDMFGEDKLVIPGDSLYLVSRGAAICAGGASIHIDSRAYSNIGVLIHGKKDVDIVVRQGQEIGTGFHAARLYFPASDHAASLTVNVVEFTGSFSPRNCSIVYTATVTLKRRAFAKDQAVRADFSLDSDNLLSLTLTQTDGSKTDLSIRI